MKNKIIFLLFLIIIIIVGLYIYTYNQQNIKNENIVKIEEIPIEVKIKTEEEIKKEEIQNKIIDFKKIVASKGLIITGDIHLQNEEYIFALQKFIKANKDTPNNPKIISKIAETYFLMKNFELAYKYYSRIENEEYIDKNYKTLSYIYSLNINEKNLIRNSSGSVTGTGVVFLEEIKNTIGEFNLEKEQEFYYLNSIECINNFHNCKLNIENYFKNTEYSGKNENLENIRMAINNYKNLKLNELYYKNALIIGAFMKNKNFPIAIELSNELIKEKINYKPILKILAQSSFELNKLEDANKYLLKYATLDSKSPDVSYMIGAIAQKDHDYLRSNIFLNLAIEQGYNNPEYIYRLQLYNYLILNKQNKISELFDKIIAIQEKPSFDDILLATYYNIINNNLDKAGLLSNKGIDLYPESEDFYGFKAWILIEKKDYEQALELLEKASKINPRNALIVLNLGRISKIKYDSSQKSFYKAKAKILFKRAIEFDSAEIGDLAQKYLDELNKEKSVD